MSLRRRLLRIFLTCTVVLTFAGYFAFSTLLFSPFEDDFEFELATLVPRNVDFLLAKTDLAEAFDGFPDLAIYEALAADSTGALFLDSPEWKRFTAENQLDRLRSEMETQLAQLPIEIDPLKLFGGREVLLAGNFQGSDLTRAQMVLMGRTNWQGKLGQSLLSFPGLLELDALGISVVERDSVVSLSGGQLLRALHIARVQDVLIVGTSLELVAKALELKAQKGEDSFGLSARYADYIQNQANREPEDVELFVDHDALMVNVGFDGNVPNGTSPELLPAFLAKLFQLKLINEVEGVLGFEGGLALDLHADLSSEKLSSAQKRFYRSPDFNRERVLEVAQLAPASTGFLAYLQADVGDVLRMLLGSCELALQDNFNDQVRAIWGYSDGSVLLDEIDTGLKDRLALIVRENDYGDEGLAGPPHDDTPTLAWAVVGWSKDRQVFEDFRQKVTSNQGRFLISGRQSGSSGVFTNTDSTGLVVYEYWSRLVPGTGHIASVVGDDIFIVSNHSKLVVDILQTRINDPAYPALSKSPAFTSLVGLGLDSVSGFAWFNPPAIADSLHRMANEVARGSVGINWSMERPRIERLVLKRHFGSRKAEALGLEESLRFEEALEAELVAFETQFFSQNVSGLAVTYNRYVTYLESMRCALLELSLSPKRVDLSLRALIPLGD